MTSRQSSDIKMGKFWEHQWPSQMEGWPILAKHVRATEHYTPHSPSGSESSSFSVSTRDSPSLSGQSETSTIAGKDMLLSPDLSQARIHLLNPDTNHEKSSSMEIVTRDFTKMDKQQDFGEAKERLVQSPIGSSQEGLDDWLSDGDESWASASSQELSYSHLCDNQVSNIYPTNHCHGQGTRGSAAMEQAGGGTKQPVIAYHSDHETLSKNANMISKAQEVDAYSTRNAHCSVEGHQEVLVQEGDEHRSFARSFFEAENIALQSEEHDDIFISNPANRKPSTYIKPTSCTNRTHLKSSHSAAVENNYPSSSLHGFFRFVEQDGSPCFSFSVIDSDVVFFARACQDESEPNKKDHKFLYTFHSRRDHGKTKGGWKGWLKKEKLASSLVGRMKVSSIKCMRTENRCTEETHFVLSGDISQLPAECAVYKNDQMSVQLDLKLTKPVPSGKSTLSIPTLGSSHSQKVKQRDGCHISMPPATASQGIIRSCLHEPISRDDTSTHSSCDSVDVNNSNSTVKQDMSTTEVEIAALVITTTREECKVTGKKVYKSSGDTHGWGVTFLEKGLGKGWGAQFLGKSLAVSSRPAVAEEAQQQQLNVASKNALKSDMERLQEHTDLAETSGSMSNEKLTEKINCRKRKQPKVKIDVVVILPAGHHGLIVHDGDSLVEDGGGSCGPISLLERWRSGGICDCGGWDMGCGLSVLKAKKLKLHETKETIALTTSDQINWISSGKPLQIFTQGCKQKRLLILEIIQTGLFSLSFQARFSPLQAFATAVAIFHQQITYK